MGTFVFEGCSSLTNVTFGDRITSINIGTFQNCTSLTSINIPNVVTSISGKAFEGCTNLKNVTLGNNVTSIGGGSFTGCTSLKNITIPNSVTSIGMDAFKDCTSLNSVMMTTSVTSWGYGVFENCSNLEIYYAESKEQFSKIKVGIDFWNNKTESAIDYCTKNNIIMHFDSNVATNQNVIYKSETDILGDVDGDGKVSARDATAILKYVVGLAEFEGNSLKNALLTGGKTPSARDATQVLKMVVGLA
ncbi:MAG: leucine-rich repeat protein [Ruminococcaceae bacterium]|nr:leucine-rich repeat protein [Oscillospiraceae bacterium]